MAVTIPIISQFSDKGIVAAKAGLDNLRAKVGEAEGAFGKMKAGFGAAGDFIKANAVAMSAVAGAAIGKFVLDAIGDFQRLALEVDHFSDVTGIAAEEASRWVEVSGDLGIESKTVQDSINKMNIALQKNRDAFEKAGIAIARTNEGTIDANETFLNTIDRLNKIKDPAQRAAIATELMGKNWKESAELIEMGAGDLRRALEAVGEAKIIDEEDIQKAKDFRKAQDDLKDAFEEFALKIGQELMPVIVEVLNGINEILDRTSFWGRITRGAVGLITRDYGMVRDAIWGPRQLKEAVDQLTKSFWDQQQQMYKTRYEGLKLEQGFRDLGDEWEIFLGKLDNDEAWLNLQDKFEQAEDAARRAFAENTPAAWRQADLARINAQQGVAEYIKKLGTVPNEIQTKILAAVDKGAFNEVKRLLDELAKQRFVNYVPIRPGDTPSEIRRSVSAFAGVAAFDTVGGENCVNLCDHQDECNCDEQNGVGVSPPGGRELTAREVGRIERQIASRYNLLGNMGTVGGITVNVSGSVTSETDLIEAIRRGLVSSQRNGAQLVYSNV